MQVVTGIALATAYVTSTAEAYDSLQFITHDAPFGHLLRGMHYWGASAMVLLIGIHIVRIFLMGSYKFPREVNWLTGVVAAAAHAGPGLHRPAAALGPDRVLVGHRRREAGGPRARCSATWLADFILAGRHGRRRRR